MSKKKNPGASVPKSFGDVICQKPVIPLTGKRYGVGIAWDQVGTQVVDLDIQAVIVNSDGIIIDAVYYNNCTAMDGALGHSGDTVDGETDGIDECIWCNMEKLPKTVEMVIFVVAAYDQGGLEQVDNGEVIVFEEYVGRRKYACKIEKSVADVDAVIMFRREASGEWVLQEIVEKASQGSHFVDIIEPTIGGIIRTHIPQAPDKQTVCFQMRKGVVSDFPKDALKRLVVGIGAKKRPGIKNLDIDIIGVMYSAFNKRLGNIDGTTGGKGKMGLSHTGDSKAGGGANQASDEAIIVDLPQVPKEVAQIFFLLTMPQAMFSDVRSAHAHVTDQSAHELARFDCSPDETQSAMSGVVLGRLIRSRGNRWGFESIGKFFPKDNHWKTAHVLMHELFDKKGDGEVKSKKKRRTKQNGAATSPRDAQDASSPKPKRNRSKQSNQSNQEADVPKALVEPAKTAEAEIPFGATTTMACADKGFSGSKAEEDANAPDPTPTEVSTVDTARQEPPNDAPSPESKAQKDDVKPKVEPFSTTSELVLADAMVGLKSSDDAADVTADQQPCCKAEICTTM